ncbi:unnamed protein product [Protopolystoma xenopodis]|uniref:Uncharacterized protein n=1 Tax=Protopolystoma xenopodis TaxID=117903 RepID=A0A448WXQ9_9PLAT|nr:unnamed protein product [Protopolystoma xenopodis]
MIKTSLRLQATRRQPTGGRPLKERERESEAWIEAKPGTVYGRPCTIRSGRIACAVHRCVCCRLGRKCGRGNKRVLKHMSLFLPLSSYPPFWHTHTPRTVLYPTAFAHLSPGSCLDHSTSELGGPISSSDLPSSHPGAESRPSCLPKARLRLTLSA